MTNESYFTLINNDINRDTFNQLLSFVTPEKQISIGQFKYDIDKKLTLYSEILVRSLICEKVGIKNSEISFIRNKYGKPFLQDYPKFHYNVSHTRNAIAVAISDDPIGVDIEKIRKSEIGIAKKFFTENEFKYVTGNSKNIDERFYEIWTKKEAYIKYTGKGLSLLLSDVIDVFDPVISKRVRTIEEDGYIFTICCEWPNRQFEVIELKECQVDALAFSILR
jgi:4'-phosphopantetheinyl transferase